VLRLPPCGHADCDGPSPGCAYCGCVRRPCVTCPIRCCRRDDASAWLDDVGGSLDLAGTPWPEAPRPEATLPAFLPVLGAPVVPMPALAAASVRWDRVLSRALWQNSVAAARRPVARPVQPAWLKGDPAAVLALPPGAPVVAALVGPDEILEGLWTRQNGAWPALAQAGFAAVVGPNYSVYGDQPRFEHRLNIKRSVLAAARMRAAGVPAVPHVYVWRTADAAAVGEWATAAGLDAVAVTCQTFRTPAEWEQALVRLLALRDRMPRGVAWWFVGLSRRERILTLRGLFPGCRILSQAPYALAVHGRRILPDGRAVPWPARAADLLCENIRVMEGWLCG